MSFFTRFLILKQPSSKPSDKYAAIASFDSEPESIRLGWDQGDLFGLTSISTFCVGRGPLAYTLCDSIMMNGSCFRRLWKVEKERLLAAKDEKEKREKEELINQAKKELADWQAQHEAQVREKLHSNRYD